MDRPKGKLRPFKAVIDGQNKAAVYLKILLLDEDDKLWKAEKGFFLFDLKEADDGQG